MVLEVELLRATDVVDGCPLPLLNELRRPTTLLSRVPLPLRRLRDPSSDPRRRLWINVPNVRITVAIDINNCFFFFFFFFGKTEHVA